MSHERLILRELLRLETAAETEKLDNGKQIALVGSPFSGSSELPVLGFVFNRLVGTFPLFDGAKKNFWPVLQEFIEKLATADISSSADREEATKRRRIARGMRRMMMMMLMAGLRTTNQTSEAKPHTSARVKSKAFEQQEPIKEAPAQPQQLSFDNIMASVMGVYYVQGSFFSGSSHMFIIEAVMPHEVVYVARSYADFQAFDKQLWKLFPGKQLVRLPSKNTSEGSVTVNGHQVVLPREKLRQMLRHYLNCLSKFPQVTSSQAYLDFCVSNRIDLTKENRSDIEARIEADKQRWRDYEKFQEMARERAGALEKDLASIKREILLEDALPKIFFEMKSHKRVEDMSPILQKLVEFCLVEVASLIHTNLVARDDSPELFSQVKRLHSLMPYKIMQGILMLSNPALIMKKLSDLFMATPFGTKSLLQKIFINVLAEDSRSQGVLIDELRAVLKEEELYNCLNKYAFMDHYAREAITSLSEATGKDLVMCIIEDGIAGPKLSEVRSWHSAWQAAVRGDAADPALAGRYSSLKDLYHLVVRQRDKDIMQSFWGEPLTMKVIKQVVDMVYNILIEIFRTANVAESVGDLQAFMSDLIKCIENEGHLDDLITVLRTHQNSVFKFINRVYSKDGGFFVEIVLWLTRIVNFIRRGKEGQQVVDLEGLITAAAASNTINKEQLDSEMTALAEWLAIRRDTSPDKYELDGALSVQDIGLTLEDVDYGFAEVERDEQEEFVDKEEYGLDAVTRERRRRENLAKVRDRQNALPPRPESLELMKLLPSFSVMVNTVLKSVDTTPSAIDKGFTR